MMAEWGPPAIEKRLAMLATRIADGVSSRNLPGVRMMDPRFRAPHILSLGFAGGLPAGLVEGLASEGIHVAARLSRMRLSPHVFNDEEDIDQFVAALARRLRG
jgi:selenocysteine lyase/cysteine desulfurase